MRPAFGVFRHVERRTSNALQKGAVLEHIEYAVTVTRFVILWVTIWQHEKRSS